VSSLVFCSNDLFRDTLRRHASDWYCSVRKIRSEDVELLVIHTYKQKAIIILDWTDNLYTRACWNGDGSLMVVVEREDHQR
jgi:hypothetical protein